MFLAKKELKRLKFINQAAITIQRYLRRVILKRYEQPDLISKIEKIQRAFRTYLKLHPV
jgi:hypothetical protein